MDRVGMIVCWWPGWLSLLRIALLPSLLVRLVPLPYATHPYVAAFAVGKCRHVPLIHSRRYVAQDFTAKASQSTNPRNESVLEVGGDKETNATFEPSRQQDSVLSVLFGTRPPPKDVARLLVKRTGKSKMEGTSSNVYLSPQPVSAVGRLLSVRHLAKSLCLCDFAPFNSALSENDSTSGLLPSWIWEDNKQMTVQLVVVGGPAQGLEQLENRTVLVRGVTVVDNKDSLKNWVRNSELGVKVSSIQQVDEFAWSPLSVSRNREDSFASPFKLSEPQPKPEGLRFVRLADLYQTTTNQPVVTIVDSLATVQAFSQAISQLNATFLTQNATTYVGIDCEWKPDTLSQSDEVQPILLLQICLHDLQQVYLLDLQTLLRPLQPPKAPLTELESSVSEVIGELWRSQRFVIVGFQLVGDLRRLAASYPHMGCFGTVHGVLDVSRVVRKVMRVVTKQRNAKFVTSSLARLVEHFLQRPTDKEQQCSDWSARPLSEAQVEYASTDAAISPVLLDRHVIPCHLGVQIYCAPSLRMGRWIGDASFADCIASWEFVPVSSSPASKVHRGKEVARRPGKSYQRLFGNLPPVVTHRLVLGSH